MGFVPFAYSYIYIYIETAWVQSVSPRGLRWLTLVTLVNADYAG